MTDHDAFDEGYDAYWEGVDASDNPYEEEKDADARLSWEQGWHDHSHSLHLQPTSPLHFSANR